MNQRSLNKNAKNTRIKQLYRGIGVIRQRKSRREIKSKRQQLRLTSAAFVVRSWSFGDMFERSRDQLRESVWWRVQIVVIERVGG